MVSVPSAADTMRVHVENLYIKMSFVRFAFFKSRKELLDVTRFFFFISTSFQIVIVRYSKQYVNNFPIIFAPYCFSKKL